LQYISYNIAMDFKVPQNIEIEDKIFGPFSLRQFFYVTGGIGISYVLWRILPAVVAILLIIPVGWFTWALAFSPKEKYGKPFIDIIEAAIKYTSRGKLYTWKKVVKKSDPMEAIMKPTSGGAEQAIPNISKSKLGNLSWDVNVKSGERNDDEDEK